MKDLHKQFRGLGLTYSDLAKKLDLSQTYVRLVLLGERNSSAVEKAAEKMIMERRQELRPFLETA